MTQDSPNVIDFGPTAKSTAPVNFTVRMATGDGCEIAAVTSYIPKEGESPNALLDQIIDTLDRQRARSDVRNYDKEIKAHEDAIAKGEADIQALHEAADKKIKALGQVIIDAQTSADRKIIELKNAHEESGSGRSFDMGTPGNKREIQPLVAAQASAMVEIDKLKEESLTGEKNFRSNMAMFHDKLEKLRAERAARADVIK